MSDTTEQTAFIELATDIISAYVGNNTVAATELPALINDVFLALTRLGTGEAPAGAEPLKPAVAVKRSVHPDFIICLEDGKKFKSLKRHLRTQYGLTPAEYRQKWNLPADYPMVAPSYAESRSALAKASGLGQLRKAAAPAPEPIVEAAPAVEEKPKRVSRIKVSAPAAVAAAPATAPSKRAPRKAKAVAEAVAEPAPRPKRGRKTTATTDL